MPSSLPPIARWARHRHAAGALLAVLLAAFCAAPAHAADPLNTMRAFCQADGRGERLDPKTWPGVAALVTWPLEPAWDHVFLISGFELGPPRLRDGGVDVEVRYTITAEVSSGVIQEGARVEARGYHLERGDDGIWRIRAPAPPPYVFASNADAEALAALLEAVPSGYLSDSAFVWQMLRGAGWAIAYADTATLATDPGFTAERTAQVGDLALYYDGDRPYHVGIVESADTIVSATLNGGVRRTPFGAFAGEIRYRRPAVVASPAAASSSTPTPTMKRTEQGHR